LLQNKTNDDEIIIGLGETMLKSYDNANTWEYSFNDSPHEYFCDIKYSTIDDSLIFTSSIKVLNVFGDCLLIFYGSNNFGDSWEPIDSLALPSQQHCCHLEILKENQIDNLYFATSTGVYKYSYSVGINESIADGHGHLGLIYPNPANGFLLIDVNSNSNIVHYTILSPVGKIVMEGKLARNSRIDISGLGKGIYIIVLETEESTVTRKFVKQ